MIRKLLYVLTGAGVLIMAGGLVLRTNATERTKAYFALQQSWKAHWPLSRGKWLPLRVLPVFEPFVPVRVEVEPGIDMLLDPRDLVSRTILDTGQWEAESCEELKQHLPVGGTFVDVGAHIGYYSLKAAKIIGTTGRVIAVEPNPDTVQMLRENIRASQANVITVQPVACSDTEAVVDLFAAAPQNTGETSLSRENALDSGGVRSVYRVRARPLDAIIQEMGVSRVDAVKIDVEGAELLVLKGARQTLARYSPFLVVEIIDRQLRAMGASAFAVEDFLHSQGYTPRRSMGMNVAFAK